MQQHCHLLRMMLRNIFVFLCCSYGVCALLVAPSSASFDVVLHQTYQLDLFSPFDIDSLTHTCPIDTTIEQNVILFSLNDYAINGTIMCELFVFNSQNKQVKASITLELLIQKNETRAYEYELIHYTPFVGTPKGKLVFKNTGNIVLYPTFISTNSNISQIVLPAQTKELWMNISDSYILFCEKECEVLLPTQYIQLSKPNVTLTMKKRGDGTQITIGGIDFPVEVVLHTNTKDMYKNISESGVYYYSVTSHAATVMYESHVLAYDQVKLPEKKQLFSTKFIIFCAILLVLFLLSVFFGRKKE